MNQPLFTFRRIGRTYHLRIDGPEDLRRVPDLDEALWVATRAPVSSLSCDLTFLRLIDTAGDGEIRSTELAAAIRWLFETLHDPSGIAAGNTTLELAAIRTDTADGANILDSARQILVLLGTPEETRITLDQVRQAAQSEEQEAHDFIAAIVGETGDSAFVADTASLATILDSAGAYLDWRKRAVSPLGSDTADAWAIVQRLRAKIDQYFALAHIKRFDPRLRDALVAAPGELTPADIATAEQIAALIAEAPLAEPTQDGTLDLTAPIHPDFARDLEQLRTRVLVPVLGEDPASLDQARWQTVQAYLAPYGAWLASSPGTFEGAKWGRLRAFLDDPENVAVLGQLAARREVRAEALDRVNLIEKLILYQAWMLPLANSFVSFPDLYDPQRLALFEIGWLVIDGREFHLAVKVRDRAEHVAVSSQGNMFVLYVDVSQFGGKILYQVAVPVTSGGRGKLHPGKRGIFHEVASHGSSAADKPRGGSAADKPRGCSAADKPRGCRSLDAVVVWIVENPISIREAVGAPFARLGKALTGKIEALTSAAEERLQVAGTDTLGSVGDTLGAAKSAARAAPAPAAPVPAAAGSLQARAGLLAGGGIAIAALGSSAAFVIKAISELDWSERVVGLIGTPLAVVSLVFISALMKLRRRDLSTLLEGAGWAINLPMRLTRRQRHSFTRRPSRPTVSRGWRRWLKWIVLAAILAAILAAVTAYWR